MVLNLSVHVQTYFTIYSINSTYCFFRKELVWHRYQYRRYVHIKHWLPTVMACWLVGIPFQF